MCQGRQSHRRLLWPQPRRQGWPHTAGARICRLGNEARHESPWVVGRSASLEKDKYTPTARKSVAARVRWWQSLTEAHGGCPFPIDRGKLRNGAARLKEQGYRSAAQCLYSMKREHVIRGFKWPQALSTELKECIRSCTRGLGPAAQASPLSLTSATVAAACRPCALASGIHAILMGAWWLLREVELAGIVRSDLTWEQGEGCGIMTILLAVSKADPSAKGVRRTLACACQAHFALSLQRKWS